MSSSYCWCFGQRNAFSIDDMSAVIRSSGEGDMALDGLRLEHWMLILAAAFEKADVQAMNMLLLLLFTQLAPDLGEHISHPLFP